MCERNVAGCRPVDDARQVDHPQRCRTCEHDEADESPELAHQEQRFTSHPIGCPPEKRPGDELTLDGYRVVVERVEQRRVTQVSFEKR